RADVVLLIGGVVAVVEYKMYVISPIWFDDVHDRVPATADRLAVALQSRMVATLVDGYLFQRPT
ncbi:MAG: hypothetical protein OSB10_12185, partial [Planctomycetota bacterium]|nr:hypothetical protein [Planctomycetota bacterium]